MYAYISNLSPWHRSATHALQVLVSLEDPGYAPEAGAAYFSFSLLPADATPRLTGGTVGAALDAQNAAPGTADGDMGADPDVPTLVSWIWNGLIRMGYDVSEGLL